MENKQHKRKNVINYFNIDLSQYVNNSYYLSNFKLFEQLKKIIDGHFTSSIAKTLYMKQHKDIVDLMISLTPNLPVERSINERLYWIFNDLHDFPVCSTPNCINGHLKLDKPKYFKGFTKGYQKHCCNQCAQLDPVITQIKRDSTFMRHGDPTYRNVEKAKQTFMANYGVDNPMKSEKFKEKLIKQHLEDFGAEWYVLTDEFKEKSLNTIHESYGEDIVNVFQAEEVKQQLRQTWMTNYGVDNPMKCPEISRRALEHTYQTCLDQYGTIYPIQRPDIFSKAKRKYKYDNVQFDSFPELAYYIWLKDNNVNFEYQPKIAFEYEYEDVKHFYHPDFLLVDSGKIIDIKCKNAFIDGKLICMFDRSLDGLYEAKQQCMLENNVYIMLDDEYFEYVKYVENKFGKKFKKECRNKDT